MSDVMSVMQISGQVCKVLLASQKGRYLPYFMEAIEEQLFIYRKSKDEDRVIAYDLNKLHITSIDTIGYRCYDKEDRHYGAQLTWKTGSRKIYFMSIEQMEKAVNYVLAG